MSKKIEKVHQKSERIYIDIINKRVRELLLSPDIFSEKYKKINLNDFGLSNDELNKKCNAELEYKTNAKRIRVLSKAANKIYGWQGTFIDSPGIYIKKCLEKMRAVHAHQKSGLTYILSIDERVEKLLLSSNTFRENPAQIELDDFGLSTDKLKEAYDFELEPKTNAKRISILLEAAYEIYGWQGSFIDRPETKTSPSPKQTFQTSVMISTDAPNPGLKAHAGKRKYPYNVAEEITEPKKTKKEDNPSTSTAHITNVNPLLTQQKITLSNEDIKNYVSNLSARFGTINHFIDIDVLVMKKQIKYFNRYCPITQNNIVTQWTEYITLHVKGKKRKQTPPLFRLLVCSLTGDNTKRAYKEVYKILAELGIGHTERSCRDWVAFYHKVKSTTTDTVTLDNSIMSEELVNAIAILKKANDKRTSTTEYFSEEHIALAQKIMHEYSVTLTLLSTMTGINRHTLKSWKDKFDLSRRLDRLMPSHK